MTGRTREGPGRGAGRWWRRAAWIAAMSVLLLPLVAMQFTSDVHWTVADFVFAGGLLFGSLGAYEIVARTTGDVVYRAGVGLAIVATVLLIWINAAVHITDSAADGMYFGVAAIGIVGVILALIRPGLGARALLVAATATVGVTATALIVGMVPNPDVSLIEVTGLTGGYTLLFVGAAGLLWRAGRAAPEQETV